MTNLTSVHVFSSWSGTDAFLVNLKSGQYVCNDYYHSALLLKGVWLKAKVNKKMGRHAAWKIWLFYVTGSLMVCVDRDKPLTLPVEQELNYFFLLRLYQVNT